MTTTIPYLNGNSLGKFVLDVQKLLTEAFPDLDWPKVTGWHNIEWQDAIRILQTQVLRVDADGNIGPDTRTAIQAHRDLDLDAMSMLGDGITLWLGPDENFLNIQGQHSPNTQLVGSGLNLTYIIDHDGPDGTVARARCADYLTTLPKSIVLLCWNAACSDACKKQYIFLNELGKDNLLKVNGILSNRQLVDLRRSVSRPIIAIRP